MELSARVEYALAALIELASQFEEAEPLQIKQIAAQQGIPDRYLEHIFNALGRAGIVRGLRGVRGGYLLARQPQKITLLEVFECFESSQAVKYVQDSLSVNRSLIRDTWTEAHNKTKDVLHNCTLEDLYQMRSKYEQVDTMYYI
ncbi:RrF2 family transcriptional regulator [Egbenema bharatensis]|uniref:RrF2 family transcriptional regulator n=1 Tax=Egbenema bharatensis TaxID=3463334 RepID=UPI003A872B20